MLPLHVHFVLAKCLSDVPLLSKCAIFMEPITGKHLKEIDELTFLEISQTIAWVLAINDIYTSSISYLINCSFPCNQFHREESIFSVMDQICWAQGFIVWWKWD